MPGYSHGILKSTHLKLVQRAIFDATGARIHPANYADVFHEGVIVRAVVVALAQQWNSGLVRGKVKTLHKLTDS